MSGGCIGAEAWRDRELERLRLELTADDEYELLAWVEDETELRLLGPCGGPEDGIALPARTLRVIGLRFGPVAFVTSPSRAAR